MTHGGYDRLPAAGTGCCSADIDGNIMSQSGLLKFITGRADFKLAGVSGTAAILIKDMLFCNELHIRYIKLKVLLGSRSKSSSSGKLRDLHSNTNTQLGLSVHDIPFIAYL